MRTKKPASTSRTLRPEMVLELMVDYDFIIYVYYDYSINMDLQGAIVEED